ncbi:MAG TPA: alpha/beta hydrolase [Pyrinomonadaceae bacterium]|jgi:hypothetical protein
MLKAQITFERILGTFITGALFAFGSGFYAFEKLLFTACIVFIFTYSAAGQEISGSNEQKQIPVILISGLGGSILSKPSKGKKFEPCRGNPFKNWKRFIKGITADGFPKNAVFGDPANLAFKEDGSPDGVVSAKLEPTGFVNLPLPFKDICGLSLFLQKNKYKRDVNLFEFYYDFRYSVQDNAKKLELSIEELRTRHGFSKINLIAHSLGGLIAKQYLTAKANADVIDKLILVGTPNLGAPIALIPIRYGANALLPFNIPFLKGCNVKEAFHNAPGFFNLLPGRKYFLLKGGYFIDSDDIDKNGKTGLLDFDETVFNLENGLESKCLENNEKNAEPEKLSKSLLGDEFQKFTEKRDNWVKPPNVKVYVFAGYGLKTLETIEDQGKKIKLSWTPEGDWIVPLRSAESIEADKIFYVNMKTLNTNHLSVIGADSVKKNILSLLQKESIDVCEGFSCVRPLFK